MPFGLDVIEPFPLVVTVSWANAWGVVTSSGVDQVEALPLASMAWTVYW